MDNNKVNQRHWWTDGRVVRGICVFTGTRALVELQVLLGSVLSNLFFSKRQNSKTDVSDVSTEAL